MEDWAEESPSDEEDRTEIENELYSMFYYHSVSEGLPEELSKKYCVDADDFGVTVSLKDTSRVELSDHESNNDSVNSEDESSCANERYVDGGKGTKLVTSKMINTVNKEKTVKEANSSNPPKLIKLPESKSLGGRSHLISKFQSCRYYSGNIKTNKNLSWSSNRGRNDFSNRQFQDRNVTNSTPVTKRMLNVPNQPSTKKSKLQPRKETVSTKHNSNVVDLTQEFSKPHVKSQKKQIDAPMIIISSDSEIESDSDLSCSSSQTDSDIIEESFDLMLNTSTPTDRNVCDVSYININYDWKKTSSPDGWTRSMKKFYNKPSQKLLNFDYRDILSEIRNQGQGEWSICNADLFKLKSSRRMRCLRCQQEGHLKANCTKVFSCHMCGTPGHSFKQCPSKICLKCGSKCHDAFPRSCANCVNEKQMACTACGVNGHSSKLCTSAWSSVSSQNSNDNNRESRRTVTKYCCNCGKSGHYYEDCRKPTQDSLLPPGDKFNSKKGQGAKKLNWKNGKHMKDRKHLSFDDRRVHFKGKSKIHSRFFTLGKNLHDGLSIRPFNNAKNRKISRRIMMLRKSNRKNKAPRFSHTL